MNRLPTFQVEIWQGFIFINFDAEAPPLAPRLAAVAEAIAGYDLADAEALTPITGKFPWNWKVMFENNNDGYHASKLHRGPLHDFIPSERATFPEAKSSDAGFLRFNGTLHPDASFNPTQRAVLPIFPRLTEEDRGRMTFANVPPTLSLVLTCDLVIYLILRPCGAEDHGAGHRHSWSPRGPGGSGLRASAGDDHDQRPEDHRPGHARRWTASSRACAPASPPAVAIPGRRARRASSTAGSSAATARRGTRMKGAGAPSPHPLRALG